MFRFAMHGCALTASHCDQNVHLGVTVWQMRHMEVKRALYLHALVGFFTAGALSGHTWEHGHAAEGYHDVVGDSFWQCFEQLCRVCGLLMVRLQVLQCSMLCLQRLHVRNTISCQDRAARIDGEDISARRPTVHTPLAIFLEKPLDTVPCSAVNNADN